METLSSVELRRFVLCPVECKWLRQRITSLADYFSAISAVISSDDVFWFRGHRKPERNLTPGALCYSRLADREKALKLMADFKRVAEAKLSRVPEPDDEYRWSQIAQHYGLPTRLLDWTESATTALYFACLSPASDGIVFILNPIELNGLTDVSKRRILDPQGDRDLILKFLKGGPREPKKNSYPVAVNPVWSSDRLIVQKGTFTLHGSMFSLDKAKLPSLVACPILKECKPQLRFELQRVGVDEMTLFPELEHSCAHLKMRCGLMEFD